MIPPGEPQPALLLAIETSARAGSVALKPRGATPIVRWLSAERRHTVELLPAMRDLLAEHGAALADVDVLAWSCGPGSFTGLRIGATVARLAASAANCRIVSVLTLDAIAWNVGHHARDSAPQQADSARFERVAVILDAQAGRVYGATYTCRAGAAARLTQPAVHADPAAWLATIAPPFAIVGEGVTRHRAACEASATTIAPQALWTPSAAAVAELGAELACAGEYADPAAVVPLYLRPPACEEVYEQRRAAARARRGE